jgi:transposase
MGATRVTPDEIVRIQQLYNQYGTYAAVARKVGRSTKTVARYVKLQGTPAIVKHTFKEVVRQV